MKLHPDIEYQCKIEHHEHDDEWKGRWAAKIVGFACFKANMRKPQGGQFIIGAENPHDTNVYVVAEVYFDGRCCYCYATKDCEEFWISNVKDPQAPVIWDVEIAAIKKAVAEL